MYAQKKIKYASQCIMSKNVYKCNYIDRRKRVQSVFRTGRLERAVRHSVNQSALSFSNLIHSFASHYGRILYYGPPVHSVYLFTLACLHANRHN